MIFWSYLKEVVTRLSWSIELNSLFFYEFQLFRSRCVLYFLIFWFALFPAFWFMLVFLLYTRLFYWSVFT